MTEQNSWTITIPDWLPLSGNTYERKHWAVRRNNMREAISLVAYCGGNRIPKANSTTRRRVHIHLNKGRKGKLDDAGNLDSRSKQIYDALVHLQLLWDDDHTHLTHEPVTQHAPTRTKKTVITITEDTPT